MSDEEIISLNRMKLFARSSDLSVVSAKDMNIVVNLVEKQQKEIEHQKEKRENQKKELAILNAKQIEFNKLVNTVNSYNGQFKRQEKEIEELKKNNGYHIGFIDGGIAKRYEYEDKIINYINKIQKVLDKYKIKNTNTYIQIEGNPEIDGLLIQKATLEELIKELEKE